MKKVTIPAWIVVGIVAALLLILLPAVTRQTNCGGNSAALSYTAELASYVSMALVERRTNAAVPFVSLVAPATWHEVFRFGWGVKSYWIRKDITLSETGPIVICAQCFGNVPQPSIWNLYHRNPSFAAGFLGGHSRLLNMAEYNSVDFSGFTYVTEQDVSKQPPLPISGKPGSD